MKIQQNLQEMTENNIMNQQKVLHPILKNIKTQGGQRVEQFVINPTNKEKLIATLGFRFNEIIVLIPLISLYYVITIFEWKSILIFGSIYFVQILIKRNYWFIEKYKQIIKPLLFFKQFTRIYQQPITNPKSLFTFHPHSLICLGLTFNINASNDIMSSMVGLVSRAGLIILMFLGIFMKLWGYETANPSNFKKLMKQGKTIGLVPGGFEESNITTPNQFRVYIKQKKGFIKYALQNNYTIYPVLILKEHKIFKTFDFNIKIKLFLSKLKIFCTPFIGPCLNFMPSNLQIITIVGKGIKRRPNVEVSSQQINRIHAEYIDEVKRIYEKYKSLNNNTPIAFY